MSDLCHVVVMFPRQLDPAPPGKAGTQDQEEEQEEEQEDKE